MEVREGQHTIGQTGGDSTSARTSSSAFLATSAAALAASSARSAFIRASSASSCASSSCTHPQALLAGSSAPALFSKHYREWRDSTGADVSSPLLRA